MLHKILKARHLLDNFTLRYISLRKINRKAKKNVLQHELLTKEIDRKEIHEDTQEILKDQLVPLLKNDVFIFHLSKMLIEYGQNYWFWDE